MIPVTSNLTGRNSPYQNKNKTFRTSGGFFMHYILVQPFQPLQLLLKISQYISRKTVVFSIFTHEQFYRF